jgi:signal transduction histidine kinase
MTIRTRLTLLFSGIVTTLLVIFCIAIFLQNDFHRKQEFKKRLREEARTSADILFGKDEISPDLLKLMDKNQMTVLHQEEIVIYDVNNKIVHESGTDYLDIQPEILQKIRLNQEHFFQQRDREVLGFVYQNTNQKLVVIASANDKYGLSEQRNLGFMLVFGGISMVFLVCFAGWFFAGRSLEPIKKIIKKIDNIEASAMNIRLNEGNKKDEIAQLSQRFNRMLDRLEKAFQLQRSFVSHASHELRTPLTAITGQIQVSLLAEDNPQELKLMIQSVLEDVQQLNRLTNNLLEMTTIDADHTVIKRSTVNVAEVIWQIRSELLKKNPHHEIITKLDISPDLRTEVEANPELLYLAFLNLIENGVKFSPDNRVEIVLKANTQKIMIAFKNQGNVIPAGELSKIFEPFKRGSNSRNIKGHGVGLSLTKRIIQLHNGEITVQSSLSEGNVFYVVLPRI